MIPRRGWVLLVLLLIGVAEPGAARERELWRGSTSSMVLVNQLGGVRVERAEAHELVVLTHADGASIEASGDPSETTVLELRGDAAEITLRVPAGCEAEVRTGAGDVTVEGVSPLSVETVTGDVTLFVPAGANLAVELATSGEITVDYSVEIDYRYHQEPAKSGWVRVGDGAIPMRLASRRGAVRVLRKNPEELDRRSP